MNLGPPDGWIAYLEYLERKGDYRHLFMAVYGPFPHPCYFCGKPVEKQGRPYTGVSAVIHHLEESDPPNNDPLNLVPAHRGCHNGYHSAQAPGAKPPGWRENVSSAITAKWQDPEYRAKLVGRKRSEDAVARMRAAALARDHASYRDPEFRSRSSLQAKRNWDDPVLREQMSAPIREANAALLSCRYCGREVRGYGSRGKHEKACRQHTPGVA